MPVGRKEAFSIQLLQLLDAGLVWFAFWMASFFRGPIRETLGAYNDGEMSLSQMSWVLYIVVPFTPLALEFFQFYRRPRTKTPLQAFSQLVKALLFMALAIGMMVVFAQISGASRLILGVGGALTLLILFARDRAFHSYLHRQELRDYAKERIIIAGSDEEIDAFLGEVDEEVSGLWKIVARFDLAQRPVDELYALLKEKSVERVIFAARDTEFGKVAEGVEACELQGVEAWIVASFIRTQIARPTFDVIGKKPMLVLRSTPELSWELACKAVIDMVGSFLLIFFTSPLWLIAIIGIKITSPSGPVFFRQRRAGRYGKPFRMWKFRTMVPDAEAQLAKVKEEHGNHMEGPVFKLDRDPRVFAFGALLRKLSIDELPQLLNVLRGHMSLVGPRPLPIYEVDAFEKSEHRRRLSVKPGITCEWQAGGRNKITSFEQWVEMDLRYIDNWSLWLDIKILFRTIPAVLLGRGAN
ncbi:sugar transferase [Luteolibacter sp. GHJ8]|uniref:Sugar transferase n=1 Tax=Luteolibacter rhizosphaerae TaxID=2989719 RepID=A0ABT3FYN8_9BACT|nr:sugar transferase [Luteolibacter rhizosphaerae]MCW1912697.1 sugar transferase [Luteolibacter rhizosphaerae]